MALVGYDASSSDESEEEQNPDTLSKVIILNGTSKATKAIQEPTSTNEETSTSSQNTLFTLLPQPRPNSMGIIEEENDEFLQKRETATELKPEKKSKQPIKITVPSLSNYSSDEDEPKVKKIKPSSKASGLFALLPPPKSTPVSTKSFVPKAVAQNKKSANKLVPTKFLKTSSNTSKSVVVERKKSNLSDDSDDDIEIPDTFDDEAWEKVCGTKKKSIQPIREDQHSSSPIETYNINIAPETVEPYNGLNNNAFKQLVGKMRKNEDIKVIDINEDDVLPDRDTWMIKSITDPTQAPKYTIKDPVNDTCKRKHHITYLAQQAKANEQDLQTQWASNRFTRKQTQAKYGF